MESDKIYAVIVSREAEDTLLRHTEFLARVSIHAANKMVEEFDKALESLTTIPQRCPFYEYPDTNEKMRQLLFYKRYKLIFRISATTVYLDTVVDCRQED